MAARTRMAISMPLTGKMRFRRIRIGRPLSTPSKIRRSERGISRRFLTLESRCYALAKQAKHSGTSGLMSDGYNNVSGSNASDTIAHTCHGTACGTSVNSFGLRDTLSRSSHVKHNCSTGHDPRKELHLVVHLPSAAQQRDEAPW